MYCGQRVRERALKDHFKSRKCVAARTGSGMREEMLSLVRIHAHGTHSVFSGRFELASVIDPEVACYFLLATLWAMRFAQRLCTSFLTLRMYYKSRHQNYLANFWAFRGLAIRSLRRQLVQGSNRSMAQVFLLYMVDWQAFGMISEPSRIHERYLLSWPHSNWHQLENVVQRDTQEASRRLAPDAEFSKTILASLHLRNFLDAVLLISKPAYAVTLEIELIAMFSRMQGRRCDLSAGR